MKLSTLIEVKPGTLLETMYSKPQCCEDKQNGLLIDESKLSSLCRNIPYLLILDLHTSFSRFFHNLKYKELLTNEQVPLRTTTIKDDKLGVPAGSGSQASSVTVVSFEVA